VTTPRTNTTQKSEAEIIRELIGQRQDRTFVIVDQQRAIDEEARTVQVAFASETPIERWYGTEVLRCDPGSVMLERLNNGGALLADHNTRNQVGAVVRGTARADGDRICRATVKFSQRRAGADEFQDVKDEIRSQISVGYVVHEYTVDKDTETYTATRWEPLEISTVSIAADVVGAGVGRDHPAAVPTPPATPTTPTATPTTNNLERGAATMEPNIEQPTAPAIVSEVARATEIMDLAKVIDAPGETLAQEVARDAIAGGKTLAEFRQMVFDKRREREQRNQTPVTVQGNVIDLTEREKKQFSIRNAILADVNVRMGQRSENSFELEISEEIAKRLPANHQRHGGILIPTTIALRGGPEFLARRAPAQVRAGLDTKTSTKGQELVFTEFGSFIDLLRNRALVIALGATVLPGLQGNVAFPRQTGAGTLVWVTENPGSDVAESNLTLDQVVLSPKTAQSTTSYSRQLLAQSAVDVDGLVMNDLSEITALGIDLAALHGTGAPQPTGIYTATGVNSVAFGGSVTYEKLVAMETEVASDNADIGTMAYLATPQARGKGKITPELAGELSQPIWRGNEVNGYRAEVTNQLKKNLGVGTNEHGLVFGVWSQLMIGEWGVLEIITDPYAKKKQGMIEVTSFIMVDVQLRHGESFCKATGLIP
jgi:HK97 family phage major capsid protein